MKKHITIAALSLSIAMLAACAGNTESPGSTGDSTPTNSVLGNSSDSGSSMSGEGTPAPESPINKVTAMFETPNSETAEQLDTYTNEITARFETPNGEPADLTGAMVVGPYGVEVPFSEMTADNWIYVHCDDYVYLAEPLGIAYNSVDNADIFNENDQTFDGVPQSIAHTYKKYKVGDTIGGLTLTYAYTTYMSDLLYTTPKYFNGGSAFFDGQLTLTGKCRLAPEDEGHTAIRDIQFVPNAESSLLPIMNYEADAEGNEPLRMGKTDDLTWCGEYMMMIYLGNADNYSDFDFGEFPDDGSFVDVRVTINNVRIRNEISVDIGYGADILEIEVV